MALASPYWDRRGARRSTDERLERERFGQVAGDAELAEPVGRDRPSR